MAKKQILPEQAETFEQNFEEMQAENAGRKCKQEMLAGNASRKCKHASRNCKQKLQAEPSSN